MAYDFGRLIDLGVSYRDAQALRRIAMTLHRWHELECGDGNQHGSWCITRGKKSNGAFHYDDDGRPYLEHHHYLHGRGNDYVTYSPLPDRETGARKRLGKIMAKYTALQAYVQTDPRGAPLYILPPNVTAENYNNGIAVYR